MIRIHFWFLISLSVYCNFDRSIELRELICNVLLVASHSLSCSTKRESFFTFIFHTMNKILHRIIIVIQMIGFDQVLT